MKLLFPLIHKISFLAVIVFAGSLPALAQQSLIELIESLKPAVVNINVSVSHGLDGDDADSWTATGFIADAGKGLIVTNAHVSGKSPAQYKVTFHNGESTTKARRLHYDAWHDFAILQVEPQPSFGMRAVALGDSSVLREMDKILLIGNDGGEEYTVLSGHVNNIEVNAGNRHSASFRVKYENRGGSSGSPVFDLTGKVVGLHYKGTDSSGAALRIEYVQDALAQLLSGNCCRRGDIGVTLDLMNITDAQKHLRLPSDQAEKIRSAIAAGKKTLYAYGVTPGSPAANLVEPGDIVVSVDGVAVGNDLYAFDKAVDQKIGSQVSVGIVRNGLKRNVPVSVLDAERGKTRRFALFGGGLVQDVTAEQRRRLNIGEDGVFLAQTEPGSSLDIGSSAAEDSPKRRAVLIQAVNGIPTPNLDAFIQEVSRLRDGDNIYLTFKDLWRSNTAPKIVLLTLDLKFFPLKTFAIGKDGTVSESAPHATSLGPPNT